jgi:hypothetical protein
MDAGYYSIVRDAAVRLFETTGAFEALMSLAHEGIQVRALNQCPWVP